MRALEWIVGRVNGTADAKESPLGWLPTYTDLNWEGLEGFSPSVFESLMSVDPAHWQAELQQHDGLFEKLGAKLPGELAAIRMELENRLQQPADVWEIPLRLSADELEDVN
jgi:phosphoenolpyruvate carboxykinase (GTP)